MRECSLLTSDVEESDTTVWLHVVHSAGTRKPLFSSDTDVYHVSLPLLNSVCVRPTQPHNITRAEATPPELQLDHAGDPDLALVPPGLRACVVQTLCICSGCDCVSFFAGFGKVTIMRHFFENAWFITGTQDIPDTLADTVPGRVEEGFMSFVRLVGTIYFKKHLAQFTVNIPRALYMSLTQSDIAPMQQHKKFIEVIRETVWSRIQFEDELPPSFDALWRH